MKGTDGREIASERGEENIATAAARTGQPCLLFIGILTLWATLFTHSPGALAANQFGAISLQVNEGRLIPGNLLEITYSTSPGTLSSKVDFYFSLLQPTGQLLFLQSDGTLADSQAPFRSNVTVIDETQTLLHLYPVYIPFGTFTASIVMLQAGGSLLDADAYVSPVSSATFFFTPLSQAQQDVITQRGNPQFLVTTWVAAMNEKRDSWIYLSSNPTKYVFVNGVLESQSAATGSASGPAPSVDPSLLTPQTTLEQLTALFGPPTSIQTLEGASDYQTAQFSNGLGVVLVKDRLSAANTFSP